MRTRWAGVSIAAPRAGTRIPLPLENDEQRIMGHSPFRLRGSRRDRDRRTAARLRRASGAYAFHFSRHLAEFHREALPRCALDPVHQLLALLGLVSASV